MVKYFWLLIIVFGVNSNAAKWVKIAEDNIKTSYIDIERLKNHEEVVLFWTLADYKNNDISAISKYKALCEEEKKYTFTFPITMNPWRRVNL